MGLLLPDALPRQVAGAEAREGAPRAALPWRVLGALREHVWLALGAALLSWFIAFLWWAMLPSTSTVEVTIPPGTSELVAAGEIVEVLPAKLSLRVGDELFIRNSDAAVHRIGPAFVPPGEAISIPVTRSFFDAATLVCSFHPSGGLPVVPLARPHVLTTIPIGLLAGIPLALAAMVTASITARLNTEESTSDEDESERAEA